MTLNAYTYLWCERRNWLKTIYLYFIVIKEKFPLNRIFKTHGMIGGNNPSLNNFMIENTVSHIKWDADILKSDLRGKTFFQYNRR